MTRSLALFLALTACADSKPTSRPAPAPAPETSGSPTPTPDSVVPPLLAVGSPAPALTAPAHDGTTVSLVSLRGSPVVVYFYPADETPGCTAEAEAFRDELPDLAGLGARVIGVSTDSLESHREFAANRKLSFPLLADPDGAIARAFGVPLRDGRAARVTFVIGPDGTVARVFPAVKVDGHVDEVVAAVRAVAAPPPG